MSVKTETFLWEMVTADFFGFRNIDKDTKQIALADQIKSALVSENQSTTLEEIIDDLVSGYALRLVYTLDLRFNWDKKAPEQYRALETWWKMVKRGDDIAKCYQYYTESITNVVSNEYQRAITRAHTIWTPEEENNTAESENNPN